LARERVKFRGMKEIVVDFLCREDLAITTLKEFLELFVSSIKKQQCLHSELMNPAYQHFGIKMQFNNYSSIATIRIFLA